MHLSLSVFNSNSAICVEAAAAAGDAKSALEAYVKAPEGFANEAKGHNKALTSKLQGPSRLHLLRPRELQIVISPWPLI